MAQRVEARFPAKCRPLFQPARYKILHGGRGSAKSWSIARALLIQAAQRPLRVLCTREVQRSLRDSVHKLLCDQIHALGLGAFYDPQQAVIRAKNGSEFVFSGLLEHTIDSIKSFEGADIVWIEEGHAVSERSLRILIPTIRKTGSEIWVSMNPELDTDPAYVQFVLTPPPGAVVIELNWRDNPWFGETELAAERLRDQARMPKHEYDHVWEGKCLPAISGAIYSDEVAALIAGKRVCPVPYDPALKVHVIFDLGWSDAMAVGLVQRLHSQMRVIEYLEDTHKTLDWWSAELRQRRYNWGTLWLPHDGARGDYQTGKSAQQIMQGLGWDVRIVPNQPVEAGIRQARMMFPRALIDSTKAARLVECLKRYRRHVPQQTQEPTRPVHDEYSHGADMWRYLAIAEPELSNEDWNGKALSYPRLATA
jgi:phage terminase large subunit